MTAITPTPLADPVLTDGVMVFRQTLLQEGAAILAASEKLTDAAIGDAVQTLTTCAGKIVLFGVGKSGLIARKVAATFASLGTTALFVHAAEAMHGDLGLLSDQDVVLAFSNSGETDELLVLLPHIRRKGVAIIAIVGNTASTLARHARVVVNAAVAKEACPLNLAPTASTAVALAIGDGLAMAVASSRRVTSRDFAVNHPAGRLGKRLTLTVADLMHSMENNPVVSESADLSSALGVMTRCRMGAVNVIGSTGELVGIITDGDLRRALQANPTTPPAQLTSSAVMTRGPVSIGPSVLAIEALRIMEDRPSQISVLPVVSSDSKPIGMIHLHDLIRAGL